MSRLQELDARIALIPATTLDPQQPLPPPPGYQEAEDAVRTSQNEVAKFHAQLSYKRTMAQDAQTAHRTLSGKQVGPCSKCGQPVTEAMLQAECAEAKSRYDFLVAEGLGLKAGLEAAEVRMSTAHAARQEMARQWEEAKNNASREHAKAASAQHQLRELMHQAQQARRDENKRLAELEAIEKAINPFIAQQREWEAALGKAETALSDRIAHTSALAKRVEALEFWQRGFGAKGLKSYVLDSKIGEMGQEANRWVQLLTGGTTWVEFSTQREVGKGRQRKLVEDLSIRIFRANPDATVTERDYRTWSGGEKYRVSLGIDFGFARLVAKRARCAYDMLAMDELFGRSLDVSGKEAVAELLQALAKEKSTIFVTDHEAQFQHMFDSRMVIRKHHRRSAIVDSEYGEVLKQHPAFP
jgi:DNA repair exonuclease SbcCD ATPase subunit